MSADPTDDFPRQKARTRGFRLGLPTSATILRPHEGAEPSVLFLRTRTGSDPVHCLWLADRHGETCLVDPRDLVGSRDEALPQAERDRKERMREVGSGITSYSTDRLCNQVAFTLDGHPWLLALGPGGSPAAAATRLPVGEPVAEIRLNPTGTHVAYVRGAGTFAVLDLASEAEVVRIEPADPLRTWGLPDFIAAEEMNRYHGYWWSPDGNRLIVAEVDNRPVQQWWISEPSQPDRPPRPIRYPAAGTANADVQLWVVEVQGASDLPGDRREITWDQSDLPYVAAVHWQREGAVIAVQSRDQRRVEVLGVDADSGSCTPLHSIRDPQWVDLVPGTPRLTPAGQVLTVEADHEADTHRVHVGDDWVSRPQWYVRQVHRVTHGGVLASATQVPTQNHIVRFGGDGSAHPVTTEPGWHVLLAATTDGDTVIRSSSCASTSSSTVARIGDAEFVLRSVQELPSVTPRATLINAAGRVRVAVLLPSTGDEAALPVIVASYGGPHAQLVTESGIGFVGDQWLADQGFAVVVIDGSGTPGHSVSCERAIHLDLADPVLNDQIEGLRLAADAFPGRLDLQRVGIRGWSFGGYLAALAVLRRPDIFHAALAGAPVTEWRLYDTHYTERYLGDPADGPATYDNSSLIPSAAGLSRPLMLVHGLADDNVVAAHTLQLSSALLAHGREHHVLPLAGVTHMTPQEVVTENLLNLEVEFFRTHLRRHRA